MTQRDSVQNELVISYLLLRRLIGVMGLALPVLVVSIPPLLWAFAGHTQPYPAMKGSISEYYGSPARDVFVGILFALGAFLFSYRGHTDGQLQLFGRKVLGDNGLANISAMCAFATALFPVTSSQAWVRGVHVAAAGGLFFAFVLFAVFQFTRGTSPYNRAYRVCGILVAVLLVTTGLYKLSPAAQLLVPNLVFYLEAAMLNAFGAAWLLKGKALEAATRETQGEQ